MGANAEQDPDARVPREEPGRTSAFRPSAPSIVTVARSGTTRGEKKPRIFTHAHRQRFERSTEHYLRKCYRAASAARASELAMEMGLTPEYASWLAKQLFGKSLHDYLRGKQVTHAAWLLRTLPPEITIEEVALRSGFGTTKTLYRCFCPAYGMTPGAFRGLKK